LARLGSDEFGLLLYQQLPIEYRQYQYAAEQIYNSALYREKNKSISISVGITA